jgi:hypothetical protein
MLKYKTSLPYKILHFMKHDTNKTLKNDTNKTLKNDTNEQITYYNEIQKSTIQSVENIKNKLQEKKYNVHVIYDENVDDHEDNHGADANYKSFLFFFMSSYILYYYYKKM